MASLRANSGKRAGDVPAPVFCDLKGAHLVPPLAKIRHNAAAMMPFPVPDMVPNTAILAQFLLSRMGGPLVLRLEVLGVGDMGLVLGGLLRCGRGGFRLSYDSGDGIRVDVMDGDIS